MNQTTDIAVTTAPEVSLASALHIGVEFASTAVLGTENYPVRRVTWATGNNDMFAENGKTALESARGFLIDRPDPDEMFPEDWALVDAMELLVARGMARSVVVAHQDKDKRTVKVPCWQLSAASLFVLCAGVPDQRAMENNASMRLGVAYAGYRTDANGQAQSSEVHFMAFIQELMQAGYPGVFAFQFRSFVSPKILATLKAQESVLRFVNSLRADASELNEVAYYACALPVQVSAKTLEAGSVARGGVKQVYYPVPAIPRLSYSQPETAQAYLSRVAITREQLRVVEADDRIGQAIAWSQAKTQRLLTGDTSGDGVPVAPDDDAAVVDATPF